MTEGLEQDGATGLLGFDAVTGQGETGAGGTGAQAPLTAWPPLRCLEMGGDGVDLGEQPAGKYTFHYMQGALQLGEMPTGTLDIDFEWSCARDLDVRVDFLDEANGYNCWYGNHPNIAWHGIPNYHNDATGGSPESYSINLYETWENGDWGGQTPVGIYAWWFNTGGGPTCDVTVNITWAAQTMSRTIPEGLIGENSDGYGTCPNPAYYANHFIGNIICYEGGYFTVTWI